MTVMIMITTALATVYVCINAYDSDQMQDHDHDA